MRTALLAGAIIAGLSSAALAKIEKLSEVAWWAAHGGLREDGAFVCAMVTSTPDGRDGKLVIEYVKGTDVFRIDDTARTTKALSGIVGKRLMYRDSFPTSKRSSG